MKKNININLLLIFITINLLVSCNNNGADENPRNPLENIQTIKYTLINTFPHDTNSFTEGLLFHDNKLFESTGSPSEIKQCKSVFGYVNLVTGKIQIQGELDSYFFGEGTVFFGNNLYQLTYKDKVGFIYDSKTFKLTGKFWYENEEGWGLTEDGTNLIMSDGTNSLTYIDPVSLKVVNNLDVKTGKYPVKNINELEFIKGYIYANVWLTDYIIKINPVTGQITGKIDLSVLHQNALRKYKNAEVLNGIAFDSITNQIFVTGKLWPYIYLIKI